jgi:hypothetical protein
MRLAPALMLALSATSIQAAFVETYNSYHFEGTWNETGGEVLVFTTKPLSSEYESITSEGTPLVETHTVPFPTLTFPSAPAGAINVWSVAYVDESTPPVNRHSGMFWKWERVVTDCGGALCPASPEAIQANNTFNIMIMNIDPTEGRGSHLMIGSADYAGKTFTAEMFLTPPIYEIVGHAHNAKTTITIKGPSIYNFTVKAVTWYEIATPEPSTAMTGLLAIGVMVLGMARKRWG